VLQSLVLNLPGQTAANIVNAAISYAESRDDVFVVVDGIEDAPSNQLTLAATYTPSSLVAVYYPTLVISDPTVGVGAPAGRTRSVGAGAAVAGLIANTDASRGVFKAPAGLQARLAGVVSTRQLTNSQLDSLNSAAAPVNAIRFIPGSGHVVMGSRTLKAGYVDKYVPVRRTLIYLRKSLTDLTQFAIFEPNNEGLWRRLDSAVTSFLTQFWSQGGLRGTTPDQAFFVKVDAENNPQYLIDNGEVHIEVGVALQRPAEFVVIKIGQFDGGTTVTVA
jgi:phage tail sheath protein FI